MARSQSHLGQKYVEALAAMRVNQRIMGAKMDGEAAEGLSLFETMVNENVRPFSTSVQHILESAQHTAKQVLPMSVRGFANLADPDFAAAIDRVAEEVSGKDWAKPYQELVQYEGSKFVEGLGSAGGQLAMQMFVSGTLTPLGLGLVGFVGTAMGYVQGTVQRDRYKYYTDKGMDEEEARKRSLQDGAFAGLMTGISESIVGGLGKFANKPAFLRNLASVAEDFLWALSPWLACAKVRKNQSKRLCSVHTLKTCAAMLSWQTSICLALSSLKNSRPCSLSPSSQVVLAAQSRISN